MEFSAGTVDEAIEKGLKALGKTRDEVEIVVIDSGAKGDFWTQLTAGFCKH